MKYNFIVIFNLKAMKYYPVKYHFYEIQMNCYFTDMRNPKSSEKLPYKIFPTYEIQKYMKCWPHK